MTDGLVVSYGGFDLTTIDSYGVSWRTLSPIQGWDGSPASSLQLTQRPRGAGAFIGPRPQLTPRTIVIEGLVDAPDPDALQAACDRLVAAVPLTAETLSITRGGTTRRATCYRQDEVLISDETDTLSSWSLQLTAPDPRRLGTVSTDTAGGASITGGLTIPFTIPFTLGATTSSGDAVLTNDGIVDGPLHMRIDGPIGGPTVTHTNAHGVVKTISLPNLDLAAGEHVRIGDIDSQYVLLNGSTPGDQYLVSRQWFAFEPGVNVFALSEVTYNAAELLTVTATSAF